MNNSPSPGGILERERALPADINAERATLGSILLDYQMFDLVSPFLSAHDFYLQKHEWIFESMADLNEKGTPPDLTTISNDLRSRFGDKVESVEYDRLKLVGGIAYLVELSTEVPTAGHAEFYARIVAGTAARRRLIETGGKISALGYDERADLGSIFHRAGEMLRGVVEDPRTSRRELGLSARDLMAMEIPPIQWIIHDFLSAGLTICASAPKFGKTWFWMDIALAAASGGKALGEIDTLECDVLYLVLEDKSKRFHRRLAAMGYNHQNTPQNLWYDDTCPKIDRGALFALRRWVDRHAGTGRPKLIIIDTYIMVKPTVTSLSSIYDSDYKGFEGLRDLAQEKDIALVAVHHTRKQDAQRVFDMITGSTGIQGVVEAEMVLYELRGQPVVELTGKDLSHQQIPLEFDKSTFRWRMLARDAQEYLASSTREAIVAHLSINGRCTPQEMAEELSHDYNAIIQALKRLRDENIVGYERKGRQSHYWLLQSSMNETEWESDQ